MSFENQQKGIRLQKVLAAAGLGSRRACEQLIAEARVEVNNEIILEQGRRVNPEKDVIRVDGSRIPLARRYVYLAINKPRGVVCTMSDPEGRPCIADYIKKRKQDRIFHVGRLDTDTEGILLLTNHGDLAHRLTHPSFSVYKTYVAQVEGSVDKNILRKLRQGITLEDGPVTPDNLKILQQLGDKTLIKVTLHEGRNRIVRRMFAAVGHPVIRLSRTGFGPIRVKGLALGEIRELTLSEVGELLDLVDL